MICPVCAQYPLTINHRGEQWCSVFGNHDDGFATRSRRNRERYEAASLAANGALHEIIRAGRERTVRVGS